MHKINVKAVTTLGVLVAMEIVLSRFCSINTWNIKIGFNFVPVVVAAVLFGPVSAACVGGLGDFLGAVLFPIGPYFPGFTLTACLMGLVDGLFLHKKQSAGRILASVAINQLVMGLLVNSLWISILYNSPYLAQLSTRAVQCALLGPVQFVTILGLTRVMDRVGKRVFA